MAALARIKKGEKANQEPESTPHQPLQRAEPLLSGKRVVQILKEKIEELTDDEVSDLRDFLSLEIERRYSKKYRNEVCHENYCWYDRFQR